mmetsp:Transcript_24923/g.64305  ORF Transcript_24923/g.64305 Transcript_24923/m.64305 type:complete len:217 (+) Transcript_24923:726-1376(+)
MGRVASWSAGVRTVPDSACVTAAERIEPDASSAAVCGPTATPQCAAQHGRALTGSPFISYARSTSPEGLVALSTGMEAVRLSEPSKCTCSTPARSASCRPQYRSTSLSRAPPHRAVDMAPAPHGMPIVFLSSLKRRRPLPPHCSVATTSCLGKMVLSCSRVKVNSRGSASPRPRTVSLYSVSEISGTGWCPRTNQRSFGVIQLSSKSSAGVSAWSG